MIFARDALAIGVAAVATIALAALTVFPAVYPKHEVLGYVAGRIQSFEFRVGPISARGFFDVRLDEGGTVRVQAHGAAANMVPGEQVCIRAIRRGTLIEGYLVPTERCAPL